MTIQQILLKNNLTASCAESLTCGKFQSILGSIDGSSKVFVGGITCYNINQKVKFLGVDRKNAEICNCVSEQTLKEMLIGCKKLFGSDIAFATTGYASPYLDKGIKIPFAWIGFIDENNKIYIEKIFGKKNIKRIEMQEFVANNLYKMFIIKKS